MKNSILFFACFLCPILLTAQLFDAHKLNNYFDTLAFNNRYMGSVSICNNSNTIYNKIVGFSNLTLEQEATAQTQYSFEAMAKIITAVLILKAEEEGRLKLEYKVDKYFPHLANSNTISIEDILLHRSGIRHFTEEQGVNSTKKYTKKDILKIINSQEVERKERTEYANENYILLAYILEQVYGKSYAHLLQKYIIKPLKLKNTSLNTSVNNPHQALLYHHLGNWQLLVNGDNSIYYGTACIASNSRDMAIFLDAIYNGLILKYETLKKYNLLENNDIFLTEEFKIKGSNYKVYAIKIPEASSFESYSFYIPKQNISIVLVSNGLNYDINLIARDVLAAALDAPYKIPEFNRPQIYTVEELDAYIGLFKNEDNSIAFEIKNRNGELVLEIQGEPNIELSSVGYDTFGNLMADVSLNFALDKSFLILKKGDSQMLFYKDFNF